MASLSAPRLFRKLHASCPQSPGVDNIGRFVKPCFTAPYPLRLLAAKVRTDIGGRPRPWAWPPACSSSAAAGVEEDEILETKTEDTTVDGRPVRTLSQEAFVKEAVRRLSEEELEVAVRKYNLEEELFAEVDYAQVNAFTDRPFSGNPAAVCYLPYAKDDTWLQVIAREFTLPATAFIVKREQKAGMEEDAEGEEEGEDEGELKREQVDFDLRWFSPKQELDLCGHATLASAHLLFAAGIVEGNVICFHTRAGVLQARKVRGYDQEATPEEEDAPAAQKKKPSGKGVVEIDLPIITAQECSSEQAQGLKEALGVRDVVWSGVTSPGNFLVELPSSEDVVAVKPRLHILENLPGLGVIVTARAGASGQHHQDVDFVSRYFAPKKGIPEDPVTGSAHCVLGWYWKSKLGKSRLEAYQASERGGRISLRVDEESGRVYMEGGAVLVMAGVILNSLRALDKQKS